MIFKPKWKLQTAGQGSGFQPVVREDNLGVGEHILHELKPNMNIEPALILALMTILPRIGVLTCQKQAQASY
jgi:hypothetical protein